MLEPGTVLFGKYRIQWVLGSGGMGTVVRAEHVQLKKPVAIKFVSSDAADSELVAKRFLREAQSAVQLTSEHVCRVHDVGTLDDGSPYMVMEYLDGVCLDEFLRQCDPAPTLVVDLALQACEALAEAHSLGIIHRDIKPGNFFVVRRADGSPLLKVLDFGISKSTAVLAEDLTSTQAVLGTPAYMSPEQMRSSKSEDVRSDIWSLGVMLHEMLSGARPFVAESFSELCIKVAVDPAPALDGDLAPGLADVVTRCLQKDPADRFANVAELAAALAPHAAMPELAAGTVARVSRILGLVETTGRHETLSSATLVSGVQASTLTGSAGQMKRAGHGAVRRHARAIAMAAGILATAVTLAVVVSARSSGVDRGVHVEPMPAVPDEPPSAPVVNASTSDADASDVDKVDIEFEVTDVVAASDAGAEQANPGQGQARQRDDEQANPGQGQARQMPGEDSDQARRRKSRKRRASKHQSDEQTREDEMFGTRK